jgi:hypothetical protein
MIHATMTGTFITRAVVILVLGIGFRLVAAAFRRRR